MRRKLNWKIQKISSLGHNWNGYGASEGSLYPVSNAYTFLEMINDKDLEGLKIFPTARESIQFEVDRLGMYLEIEIFHEKLSCLRVLDHNYQSSLSIDFSWEKREGALKLLKTSQEIIRTREKNRKGG